MRRWSSWRCRRWCWERACRALPTQPQRQRPLQGAVEGHLEQVGRAPLELHRGEINRPLGDTVAVRLTGVWQDAGGFRDDTHFDRWGLNPTISFHVGAATLINAGYEHFKDDRVAERGVPSQPRLNGIGATAVVAPLVAGRSTVFGDPAHSPTFTNTDALTLAVSHNFSDRISLRSRLRYADYDKFYQNIFPNSFDQATGLVSLAGYNNRNDRTNLFSQTDLVRENRLAGIDQTLMIGVEVGRQKVGRAAGCKVSGDGECLEEDHR